MKTCPKCYRSAEKYYYFGMSFFWRCNNQKCSFLDVEDPNSRKNGFKEEEPTEPEKKDERPEVDIDEFVIGNIPSDDGFPSFLSKLTDKCESLGLDVVSTSKWPSGKIYIDLTTDITPSQQAEIFNFVTTEGHAPNYVAFRKRSRP